MQNWFKNLISWLSNTAKQPRLPAEERSIEILPEFITKTLYVNSEIGLNVRSTPEVLADNKVEVIPYGQEVQVVAERDKWFEIEYSDDKRGWVSSIHLTEEKPLKQQQRKLKEDILSELPQFKVAVANLTDHPNTIKLRKNY